jgi:hypothetical protein
MLCSLTAHETLFVEVFRNSSSAVAEEHSSLELLKDFAAQEITGACVTLSNSLFITIPYQKL